MRVLVTGGSRGIGFAVAKHYALGGHSVCIVGRTHREVKKARDELGVFSLTSDIGEPALFQTVTHRLGGVPDIFVHAAAINSNREEDVESMVRTNIISTWRIITSACRSMTSGSIVLFSGGGVGGPGPGKGVSSLYTATKAATVQLVECLAETHPQIRINAVAPGKVATQMTAYVGDTPDKAVSLIAWLCSDAGAHVTGRLVACRDGEAWTKHDLDSSVGRLRRVSP